MWRRFRERYDITDVILRLIGFSILAFAVIGSIATLQSGKYTPRQWLDFVVSGVTQGSVYALIALGYTLVYGILRMINFAHGEVFMCGAFAGYFVVTGLNQSGFLDQNWLLGLVIVAVSAMFSFSHPSRFRKRAISVVPIAPTPAASVGVAAPV